MILTNYVQPLTFGFSCYSATLGLCSMYVVYIHTILGLSTKIIANDKILLSGFSEADAGAEGKEEVAADQASAGGGGDEHQG